MATVAVPAWERSLWMLADEARRRPDAPMRLPVHDAEALAAAYAHCATVIATHGKTFALACRLLPTPERRAIQALYAFCRVTDDIVDDGPGPPAARATALAAWRAEVAGGTLPTDRVALAWVATRARYSVPARYAEQLIEGIACDLEPTRYRTFADLAAYAYRVASTVGLMSLRIIGLAPSVCEEQAIPYVIKLGLALQLTNILRDVGEDWQTGRLYLPTEELAAFGLSEGDLAECRLDDRWRAFMRFQVARAHGLYRQAWPGVVMFDRNGRFAVAAACGLYRAILDDIAAHDYDVFHRRAHVSAPGKLRRLPGIWLQM